jgi:hypothetical protein
MGRQKAIINEQSEKRHLKAAAKLGDIIEELFDKRISEEQKRFTIVSEFWNKLLPTELFRHSKIADISGGCLKIIVDSPSYMYEFQLCSSELLKQLQRNCPMARLKRIKLVIG